MHISRRLIIAMACFFAALTFYGIGIPAGGAIFLLLGIVFEGMFWVGVLGRKNKRESKTGTQAD